jgi:hypothetical protein
VSVTFFSIKIYPKKKIPAPLGYQAMNRAINFVKIFESCSFFEQLLGLPLVIHNKT